MKNIHLLPTDKPSRLWINNLKRRLELDKDVLIGSNTAKHIYITSDEEIKDGAYVGYPTLKNWVPVQYLGGDLIGGEKKIILTTDQDLIADGVQAIDDEFLEWFVKNPSCEKIEVESGLFFYAEGEDKRYKIIIPKEEPNPHILSCCRTKEECYCGKYSKQETLEEAADKWSLEKAQEFAINKFKSKHKKGIVTFELILEILKVGILTGHKFGAKWQQERMYSEEDLIELLNFVTKEYNISNGIGWFHTHDSIEDVSSKEVLEQFKKK